MDQPNYDDISTITGNINSTVLVDLSYITNEIHLFKLCFLDETN